eukprot:1885933-Pyramimonas_sp.AAC.1
MSSPDSMFPATARGAEPVLDSLTNAWQCLHTCHVALSRRHPQELQVHSFQLLPLRSAEEGETMKKERVPALTE